MVLAMSMAGFGSFSARAVVDLPGTASGCFDGGASGHPAPLSGVSAAFWARSLGEVFLRQLQAAALISRRADGGKVSPQR
jgi:hypothetical protein